MLTAEHREHRDRTPGTVMDASESGTVGDGINDDVKEYSDSETAAASQNGSSSAIETCTALIYPPADDTDWQQELLDSLENADGTPSKHDTDRRQCLELLGKITDITVRRNSLYIAARKVTNLEMEKNNCYESNTDLEESLDALYDELTELRERADKRLEELATVKKEKRVLEYLLKQKEASLRKEEQQHAKLWCALKDCVEQHE